MRGSPRRPAETAPARAGRGASARKDVDMVTRGRLSGWCVVALAIGHAASACALQAEQDTLLPLKDGKAPTTFDALWAEYDPRKEPLDVEILKQWEEQGVLLSVLRYRIGVFKGRRAMMAAVYGFPKGGTRLPGLVQVHGGGQFADYQAPLTNAKRGYATVSIAWAGRISAPGYTVGGDAVKLFWEGKTNDPAYRATTDWGALDAYHAPCRNAQNAFSSVAPAAWTLDAVDSPRNNPWFLCALGARRALTFLEQQTEVDPARLGVYGHSMGGKITVLTAGADARVKAAAPSCGGVSDRPAEQALYAAAIADDAYLRRVACPIIFLSPANDFHGRIDDLQRAVGEVAAREWRAVCSPHRNHQDAAEYQVAGLLWFDQQLKGTFLFPATPEVGLDLKQADHVPRFTVKPDPSQPALGVEIYYTQQGQMDGKRDDMANTVNRFWHAARTAVSGEGVWTAELPLLDTARPLWAYANVRYPLREPVSGAGYYYGPYTADQFVLSSRLRVSLPRQLKEAGVVATDKPSLVIETFQEGWQREWFTYAAPEKWPRRTHKVYDPKWAAPVGAALALEVRCEQPNRLVVGLDAHAAVAELKGGGAWQPLRFSAQAFANAEGGTLPGWAGIRELRLADVEQLQGKAKGKESQTRRLVGAPWKGTDPEFRNLRWEAIDVAKPR